jgi:hypothetical protein
MAGESGNSEVEKFGGNTTTDAGSTDTVEAAFNDLLNA